MQTGEKESALLLLTVDGLERTVKCSAAGEAVRAGQFVAGVGRELKAAEVADCGPVHRLIDRGKLEW